MWYHVETYHFLENCRWSREQKCQHPFTSCRAFRIQRKHPKSSTEEFGRYDAVKDRLKVTCRHLKKKQSVSQNPYSRQSERQTVFEKLQSYQDGKLLGHTGDQSNNTSGESYRAPSIQMALFVKLGVYDHFIFEFSRNFFAECWIFLFDLTVGMPDYRASALNLLH